ncbi:MAG: hypothetical protein E6Q84_01520 [Thiothrix sp.]|nr:MAG: hypothetical protein E6Q84_01520 [Thiothrix sp.]
MQTQTLEAQKSVRKNFMMADEVVRDLDFLAEILHKNRSQIIQELIRKEAEMRRNELRLAKLKQMKGWFSGAMGDQSIQSIKAERNL